MKKNIWIWNHYATGMAENKGGRHYWFAENLIKKGYNPTIFCANTFHSGKEPIDLMGKKWLRSIVVDIPFVYVKTMPYKGNGLSRVGNMFFFYKNLFKVAKQYAKEYGKPDVILASSVHPLTLVAGIQIAKKLGVPCICEVRDLWPESIVAYGAIDKGNPITYFLYAGEKWIYKKADKIIFTMEGGKDYIYDKGWDKGIDTSKIHHVNNGVDLERFDYNKGNYIMEDPDLLDPKTFKVIYAGSVRPVNNVKKIVDIAEVVQRKKLDAVQFLIYGDGSDREGLEEYCTSNDINNIKFKGNVEKRQIPYILSKSNLNIMHVKKSSLNKYGSSMNKMFEYFASGRPTLSDCEFGYDLIKKFNCGVVIDGGSAGQLADAIVDIYNMPIAEYNNLCKNALNAAVEYDMERLTKELEKLL